MSLREKHPIVPSPRAVTQRFCLGVKVGGTDWNMESSRPLPKGTDFICNSVENEEFEPGTLSKKQWRTRRKATGRKWADLLEIEAELSTTTWSQRTNERVEGSYPGVRTNFKYWPQEAALQRSQNLIGSVWINKKQLVPPGHFWEQ